MEIASNAGLMGFELIATGFAFRALHQTNDTGTWAGQEVQLRY